MNKKKYLSLRACFCEGNTGASLANSNWFSALVKNKAKSIASLWCLDFRGIIKFIIEKSVFPLSPASWGYTPRLEYTSGALAFIVFKKLVPDTNIAVWELINCSRASLWVCVTDSLGIKSFWYKYLNNSRICADFSLLKFKLPFS